MCCTKYQLKQRCWNRPDHVYPLAPDITKKQSKSHNKQMRLIIQNKNNRLPFGHWAKQKPWWTTFFTTLHVQIPNLFGATSGDDKLFSWCLFLPTNNEISNIKTSSCESGNSWEMVVFDSTSVGQYPIQNIKKVEPSTSDTWKWLNPLMIVFRGALMWRRTAPTSCNKW